MSEWISVEDRMPEEHSGEVLIFDINKTIYLASPLKCKRFMTTCFGSMRTIEEITHWMPLPDAPKEEL